MRPITNCRRHHGVDEFTVNSVLPAGLELWPTVLYLLAYVSHPFVPAGNTAFEGCVRSACLLCFSPLYYSGGIPLD